MGKIVVTELILLNFLFMILSIIPLIFYLVSLQNTLYEVHESNRKLNPGKVWLTLIPLFGLVWQYIVVVRISDSLKAEFEKRNLIISEMRPGIGIGLTYCILISCTIIPVLGILCGIAGLICWIVYWVKINNYKMLLVQERMKKY